MHRRSSIVVAGLLVGAGLCAAPAFAKLSLAQKKQIKEWDASFAEEVDHMNDKCGTKVKASIDWKSFDSEAGHEAIAGRYSVSAYCAAAVEGLRWQCEKDDFGKTAAKRIKTISCQFAPKDKRNMSLAKGKVVYGAEFGAANAGDYVKAFYLDKLRLEEQRKMKYEDEQLAKELAFTNKQCETKIEASIDWGSFRKVDFVHDRYSVHGYCDSVLGAVERVCNDPDGKEAIQSSVKKVRCVHAGKAEVQQWSLKKGTLTWTYGWEGANATDRGYDWLMNNL